MDSVSITLKTVAWIVNPLVSKLHDEDWDKYTKHVGLDKEASSLKDELTTIKLLVEAAQSKQLPNEKVHLLRSLKDLKALVYKARDLHDELDYFRLQAEVEGMNPAGSAKHGTYFSGLKSMSLSGSSKAGATKTLKLDKKSVSTKINALVKELQLKYRYVRDAQLSSIAPAIKPVAIKRVTIERAATTSYIHETHIYGRDMERHKILRIIRDCRTRDQKLHVVAIVGHGGLGKTTLAQLVYNELEIRNYFDVRMWICVSTNFDVMGITRQMLESLTAKSFYEHTNFNSLQDILKDSLKGKTVLLVLDDIWDINYHHEWNSILAPLDVSNEKSNMVLVTTRFPHIGDMVRTTDPIRLDGLDDSSSWSLLKKSAFGDNQYEVPYTLENIGKEIARKLRGNPLAAKTVGAILKGNTDGIHWMEILKNEAWKIQGGHDDIMTTLKLSYDYLPVQLQHCFTYCSLFPKNYYFTAEDLVCMWMAQGYIHGWNKRPEDVGIEYLNALVERSFFQSIVTEEDRSGPRYVMHDLLHDLAQVVSSEECLAICNPLHIPRPPHNLRHLSIHGDQVEGIENSLEFNSLSSLIITEENHELCTNLKWDQAINIRLLILQYPRLNSFNFTSFIHLRYLKLHIEENSEHVYENILAQICKLYHLEVLDFYLGFYPTRLPKCFNNLVNLRYFKPDHLHSEIAEVGKLKNLQELQVFVVRNEKDFEIQQLAGLKELKGSLKILNIGNIKCREEAESAKLSEKELVALQLSWIGKSNPERVLSSKDILEGLQPNIKLRNLYIEYYGSSKSPSWMANHSLGYLESIRLSNCGSWEVLPNFGELRFLKELYLSTLPKVRVLEPQFHGCSSLIGFPSLKLMEVVHMAELETWIWNEECVVFPSLETLTIENCPKLTELPNFGEVRFLKELSLSSLSKVRAFTPQFHGCSSGRGFPSLKSMKVLNMAELERWVWSEQCEVFPLLETLAVENCPKLKECSFPNLDSVHGQEQISLSHLKIEGCPLLQQKHSSPRTGGTSETSIVSKGYEEIMTLYQYKKPPHFEVKLENMETLRVLNGIAKGPWNITSMEVARCPYLQFLPWKEICLLDCLERLTIRNCPKLLLSSNEEHDEGKSFLSHNSLQYLRILECAVTGEDLSYLLARLPAIRELSIELCFKITAVSVPSRINESDSEMPQTDSLDSLMFLEKLYIMSCPNMSLVNKRGLSGLTALKNVRIHNCSNILSSMTQEEQDENTGCFPGNLEILSLTQVPDKMSWSATDLTSLEYLEIRSSPILTFLDLHQFVALSELKLDNCKNLASLKGPDSLICLESLAISRCPSLVSSWSSPSRVDQEFLLTLKSLTIDTTEILSCPGCQFMKSLQSLKLTGPRRWIHWLETALYSSIDEQEEQKIPGYSFTEKQEEALLLLTALKELTFMDHDIQSLPRELYRHPSLKELTINDCHLINRLPYNGLPKSLEKVHLRGWSPELERECSKIRSLEVICHGN